jgi:hypothetical protein
MGPTPEWSELERRVSALEGERGVLDLLGRYGHAIDYGLEEEWVDCFEPDGTFEMRHRTAESGSSQSGRWDAGDRRLEGKAALLSFVERHTRAPDVFHKHVVADPRIAMDGDSATVASYFLFVMEEPGGRIAIGSFGRYRDRVVRGADGRWRFLERVAEIEVS